MEYADLFTYSSIQRYKYRVDLARSVAIPAASALTWRHIL
jgi:hypothetical protein